MRSQYCYIYGCDFKASAYGNGCTISHMRKIVKKKKYICEYSICYFKGITPWSLTFSHHLLYLPSQVNTIV